MKMEIVKMTRVLAEDMLAKEISFNRKSRPHRIVRYCNDMINGRWRLTPQGISFNKSGKMYDGGHRLRAFLLAYGQCEVNGLKPPDVKFAVFTGDSVFM